MKRQLFLSGMALMAFCLASFTLSPLAENILKNSGFEQGDKDWNKWWGLEIDKQVKHSGEASCKMVPKADSWRGSEQIIKCPAGAKNLTVSGWIKTDNFVPNGEDWNAAMINIQFLKTSDWEDKENYVGQKYPPSVGKAIGTTEWKNYTRTYAIPEGCGYIKIACTTALATSGTAWFDDVEARVE